MNHIDIRGEYADYLEVHLELFPPSEEETCPAACPYCGQEIGFMRQFNCMERGEVEMDCPITKAA